MQELIKVQVKDDRQLISARDLYKGLEIKTRFSLWVSQNFKDFEEDVDFTSVFIDTVVNNGAKRELQDYALTIDMAKQLCLLSRTEKGKQYRKYLIQVEQQWNNPAEVIRRGYALAQEQAKKLTLENANLAIENRLMKPKADYFDDLIDRKTLVNLTKTAKMLKIKRKDFINWLLDNKYLYRDAHNDLMPYEKYSNNYFEVKDSRQGFPQTLITPKGREEFNLLINHEKELQA
ncbi:anti-repressor protein [Lactobacillus bombicola]|uniref:Anti-repressor protein n=1 Tax=Lactobacillus bombicola TaxID=1505723 RepID=A0A1I1RLV4_9LACO|nr:phage antirepressor KilAC domain-containing protein [Lactobacillus bombicola]SFD34997.1 anti-repressor protein [Lactobacillus bombicola]